MFCKQLEHVSMLILASCIAVGRMEATKTARKKSEGAQSEEEGNTYQDGAHCTESCTTTA